MKKICFVIMGFGKKTDYSIPKTYDLDKTYKNIIKPVVEELGYQCVRADEIQDSGIIDKSMYALLIKADLVIADITTYNPNAIYELGIRHAAKPFSTLIMKEKEGRIPFDLNHNRLFTYEHQGEDIGHDECERCKKELKGIISSILSTSNVDSPLYQYISNISPHEISQEDFEWIITELAEKENSVFAQTEKAKIFMKENDFRNAAVCWGKVSDLLPNEIYYIQQQALCTYKSEYPSKQMACTNALTIVKKIDLDNNTSDPETLGITGAINKNLWVETKDIEYLREAINLYGKGFKLTNDYYTGENYALCLDLLSKVVEGDEAIYCKFEAKKTRETIKNSLIDFLTQCPPDFLVDKWIYATLANCLYSLGQKEDGDKYEQLFLENKPLEWEISSYQKSKSMIIT